MPDAGWCRRLAGPAPPRAAVPPAGGVPAECARRPQRSCAPPAEQPWTPVFSAAETRAGNAPTVPCERLAEMGTLRSVSIEALGRFYRHLILIGRSFVFATGAESPLRVSEFRNCR